MLPRFYKFSRCPCLNNFLQVWFIVNQRDQVSTFRHIIWDDEIPRFIIRIKVLGDMKYLMRSFKRASEAVGIWTEGNWDVKRLNSLYTTVSGKFNFKLNKSFDSLSWSLVFRGFYKRKGYIIG